MAISNLNQVLSGMQPMQFYSKVATPTLVAGRPNTLWLTAGVPGGGAYSSLLNGANLSSSSAIPAGAIPHVDPPGGSNSYLARLEMSTSGSGGVIILADRLWSNGGMDVTATTAQSITTAAWPPRDNTGTSAGAGVYLALEISAACGAAAPTITVSYTNSSGTAGRTATNTDPTANSPSAGACYRFGLQSGDQGVQSVQSLTMSTSWLSGTMNLVAYRVMAVLEVPVQYVPAAIDAVTSGMPQIFNGVVPYLIFAPNGTTATFITGQYIETQG